MQIPEFCLNSAEFQYLYMMVLPKISKQEQFLPVLHTTEIQRIRQFVPLRNLKSK